MRTALVYLAGVAEIIVLGVLGAISIIDTIRELDDVEGLD